MSDRAGFGTPEETEAACGRPRPDDENPEGTERREDAEP